MRVKFSTYSCSRPLIAASCLLALIFLSACRFGTATPPIQEIEPRAKLKLEGPKNIDELIAVFNSEKRDRLPRSLQALLSQTKTVSPKKPQRSTASVLATRSAAGTATIGSNSDFGHARPKHPLRGGFLNNPKKPQSESELLFQPEDSSATSNNTRARMTHTESLTERIEKSATAALNKADSILDSGIDRVKESLGFSEEKKTSETPSVSEEKTTVEPKREESSEKPRSTPSKVEEPIVVAEATPAQAADLSEELSKLKKGFSSKFSFGSFSLLEEGILLVGLLAAFFVVTWMRLEHEHRNKGN